MGYFDGVLTVDFNIKCKWQPASQFLFQLANMFLVLTYFVKPHSMAGLMQLRFALMMAGLCFGLWGGIVICALDCMLWNLVFAIGNALHLIYLVIQIRPKKFSDDHELIFKTLFQPVGIKRFQYSKLVSIASLKTLKKGEYYAKRGVTEANHIGIICSGSITVDLNGAAISHIDQLEFIDSPEWIATNDRSPTTYQVSLIAKEPTIIYTWQRDGMMKTFRGDGMLKNVFDSLIGKDICKKLFSLHKVFLTNEGYNISNVLHDAPLLTYSAANLLDMHRQSCDVTPMTSPKDAIANIAITNAILEINYANDVSNHNGTKVTKLQLGDRSSFEEIDIGNEFLGNMETKNLLLRESDL